MSTLRVSNIEAKADVSSPSVHEKIKVTNSEGDVLVHIDGATSGISTVGINTTVKTFDVDSNQNIDFVGNLTAPNITVTGTLSYDDVTNIDSVGVITARSGLEVTSGGLEVTSGGLQVVAGNVGIDQANPTNKLEVEGSASVARFVGNRTDALGPRLSLAKSRGSTSGSATIVQDGDEIGQIMFKGADGTDASSTGAAIIGLVDGTPGVNDMPGALTFLTTNDGTNSPTERLRIDSSGRVSLNNNSRPASDASEGAQLRVTGTPLTRNQYYSPAGDYFGSFGYTDNTYTKSWIAVDSSYNKTSSVSSGIFLSAFHSDANGSACGHTIKNVRTDAGGLIFSSVHAASSTGNPAVETERLRITTTGNLGIGGLTNPGALLSIPAGESNTPRLAIESAVDDNDFTITQYEDGNGTYTMLGQNVKLNSGGNNTILDSGHRTAGILLDARNHGAITFLTGGTNSVSEPVKITSAGTLESYSTNDTTPNIRWRSNDTNWFGALNQSVEGGTITTFLSCGGDWTANGTTYSATKALAAYPTSAIAVHNQYNSTWGSDFVFLSKLGGSSTTDGAVYEKLRINATAELVQTSATNSTNSWYSLNSNNIVKVTNGDNDIYIERVGGSNGYDQLVYKKTPMTDNCDISFRLSGSQPGGTWRHIGITLCGDGGSDFSNMDRLVIRQQGSTGGVNNRIRVDKAGGGTTADVTSASIPSFFDGTERNVLIQIRGNIIHVLSDNVLVFSEQMDAALHDVSGFFGIGIYETSGNIRLRNFQLTNYGALGVPAKRPCMQTNMSSTYGSSGSLTTTVANTGILQASAYIDLCGNYTTSGSNAYTFECPVDGVYAVNAHISMGGGAYARHIWVMSYTLGGGNLPLGTYTEVIDLSPDAHSNHSYYNLWKFTKGTRVGMGINNNSGSLSGRSFQWGIMLVS